MKEVLSGLFDKNGDIIFEYDIPRLGKRVDIVLLYKGIIFCLEFKVNQSNILEVWCFWRRNSDTKSIK